MESTLQNQNLGVKLYTGGRRGHRLELIRWYFYIEYKLKWASKKSTFKYCPRSSNTVIMNHGWLMPVNVSLRRIHTSQNTPTTWQRFACKIWCTLWNIAVVCLSLFCSWFISVARIISIILLWFMLTPHPCEVCLQQFRYTMSSGQCYPNTVGIVIIYPVIRNQFLIDFYFCASTSESSIGQVLQ